MSRRSSTVAAAASTSAVGAGRGRRASVTDPSPSRVRSGAGSVSPRTRPDSVVRSSAPTSSYSTTLNAGSGGGGGVRSRPTSQPHQPHQPQQSQQGQGKRRSSSGPRSTPSSTASSRRSSVVDSSAYRYSLHTGSVSRFPTNGSGSGSGSGSGAREILAARSARPSNGEKTAVDPSRASVSSTSSSRASSRYIVEEVAPQRRPVYLALPSDPRAVGVWSSTQSTLKHGEEEGKDGKGAERNSKIMTSFPFPHPVTPRRRPGDRTANSGDAKTGWGAAWQRLLTAVFAGPYERRLNREEQEDDQITQRIIADIANRNSSHPNHPAGEVTNAGSTAYGTIPIPNSNSAKNGGKSSGGSSPSEEDETDPYGYRRMAGPHLLPSYTTDLVARRRERRRARSRARFQCMASWTIWTVSVVLVLIVLVLLFSMLFPDRLDIPSHHDDGDDDDDGGSSRMKGARWVGGVVWSVASKVGARGHRT